MAGINPNLPNLKLQNLQLSKTAEVDTQKAEDKGVGDAKPAAVWINDMDGNGPATNGRDVKENDVFITMKGGKVVRIQRIKRDEQGNYTIVDLTADQVLDSDWEKDRGDRHTPLW